MDSGHQSKKGIRIFLRHILRKIAASSFTSLLCCGWDLREIEAIFYWSELLLLKCQPNRECVLLTRNIARTFWQEEMFLNHWWGFEMTTKLRLLRLENDANPTSYWNMKRLILFGYFWRSLCIFSETTRGKVSSWTYSSWIIYFRRMWIRWAIEKSNIQSRTSRWW